MVRAKPGKGSTSDLSMLSTGSKKPSKEEDSRLKLSINQLCWARTSPKTSQFWPAMVVDIDSIPEEVKATFRKVATLYAVRSFGEHFTYTQVTSLSCIKSWTQGVNDGSIELGKKSENFKKAVRMAQEELKVPAVQLLEDEYNKRVNEVESEFPDPDEDDALDREDQTAKNRRKMKKNGRKSSATSKSTVKRGVKLTTAKKENETENGDNRSMSPPAADGEAAQPRNANADDSDEDEGQPAKRSRTDSRPPSTERTQSEDRDQPKTMSSHQRRRSTRSSSRPRSTPPTEPTVAVEHIVKMGAPKVLLDEQVGFLGLNVVGMSILNDLMYKGNVQLAAAYDSDQEKARKLADHSKKIGARPPKVGILPKALFSHCSVVFCCLSGNDLNSLLNDEDDKTILQQILEHFDGVGDEATQEGSSKKGLVLISPMESKTLEQTIQDLSQYSNHVDVVGVGILGSKKGATVYVSGPRSLYDRCEGALQLIGSSILYAGDQSSPGQALMWSMLMNQLSMGIMKEVMATRALAQQFLIDDASLARMLVDHQKDNCWQSFVAAGLGAKTSSIKDVLGLTEYGRWNAKAAVLSSANAPQGPSKGMYVHSHLAQMMEHSTAEDETVVDTLAKAIGLGSD